MNNSAEHKRLAEAREKANLEAMGAVPERAAVGNRAGGLQPKWRRLNFFTHDHAPLADLPLG